jgi:hypothetical protein
MLKDFDVVKKQLSELAELVNKFKSEAVQLRLVELVFAGGALQRSTAVEHVVSATPEPKRRKARASKSRARKVAPSSGPGAASGDALAGAKKRASTGNGAIAILTKVYEKGYFSSPRTINDIIQHCETNLARRIKQNEISGKLARMVRAGELKRVKNTDDQYEYTKA